MISFSKLGEYGRFGNQLFQYAFLRTQAKRLGTKFYCPPWKGDTVFNLRDETERGSIFTSSSVYLEGDLKHGFHREATEIQDGTDVGGYFQSDRFFSKEDVLGWYDFNRSLFVDLEKKYAHIDFADATAIHLRLGDYNQVSLQFYVAKKTYFKKALAAMPRRKHILVFSDEPRFAREYLDFIQGNIIFIEGNKDYEDFYLMSKCHDMICSASSFSWWAAYLNTFEDKKIVMPDRWFLPGSRTTNEDIFVQGWMRIPAHRWHDHYYIKAVPFKLNQIYKRFSSLFPPSRTS